MEVNNTNNDVEIKNGSNRISVVGTELCEKCSHIKLCKHYDHMKQLQEELHSVAKKITYADQPLEIIVNCALKDETE